MYKNVWHNKRFKQKLNKTFKQYLGVSFFVFVILLATLISINATPTPTIQPQVFLADAHVQKAAPNPIQHETATLKAEIISQQSPRLNPVQFVRSNGNCNQWQPLISQYSWDVRVALAVCTAESGGNPASNNPTDPHKVCLGSRGLFQIGCDSTGNFAGMFDPALNIAQAYQLYSRRNWQPWTTFTDGAYLKYL